MWGGHNGQWKEAQDVWGGLNSEWKKASKVWAGDSGEWVLVFEDAPQELDGKEKSLALTDDGGTTFSRTLKLQLVDGDDSTTGTGEIVVDFSQIPDKDHINIVDENDLQLDFYIEEFDTASAVIGVYKQWLRDGTTQLKVQYGDNFATAKSSTDVISNDSDVRGYWLFLEGEETKDSSGTDTNITDKNNVTYDNNSAEFPSTQQLSTYIKVDNKSSHELTDKITIYGWVKPENLSWDGGIFSKWYNFNAYVLDYNNDGSARMIVRDSGSTEIASTGQNAVQTDEWTFVAGTADVNAGQIAIHVNDVTHNTSSISSIEDVDIYPRIGLNAGSTTDLHIAGTLSEVALFNASMSESEMKAIYDATKPSPDLFDQSAAVDL